MNQRKNVTPEKISEKKKHEYFLCVCFVYYTSCNHPNQWSTYIWNGSNEDVSWLPDDPVFNSQQRHVSSGFITDLINLGNNEKVLKTEHFKKSPTRDCTSTCSKQKEHISSAQVAHCERRLLLPQTTTRGHNARHGQRHTGRLQWLGKCKFIIGSINQLNQSTIALNWRTNEMSTAVHTWSKSSPSGSTDQICAILERQ